MGPVVVGIDGSPASLAALEMAKREASWRGADLEVVHVEDISPAILHLSGGAVDTRDIGEERRSAVWEDAERALAGAGFSRVDLQGSPGPTIIEHCRQVDAQLLVLSTRGKGKLGSLLVGSTAKAVASDPPCDVLLVRP